MLDYELLRLIWWALLGILLIGFAVLDGFDLGVAGLLPFVSKTDVERRIVLNTVGPVWEGNQVWLILGGGAIFAAWPALYAVSFSGFYLAIFLALFAIIIRPVGFKFRSKMPNPQWRNFWDNALFVGGIVPALIFGVAFGNLFLGVPFHFNEELRSFYTGGFFELLTPFPLLCGVLAILMMLLQGSTFLALKTEKKIQQRSVAYGQVISLLTALLFTLCGVWLWSSIEGYAIISEINTAGPSNPVIKEVSRQTGTWMTWHQIHPMTYAVPALGIFMAFMTALLLRTRCHTCAFLSSSLTTFSIIATAGLSLFPFLLPSSTHPSHSLTVWDASSSQMTLFVMLIATLIFLPIVLVYTAWVYRVLRGKVTEKTIKKETNAY
ncbi:MAG TPA: cytochrome d ubiquinol oxidase subunit II [Holosporales bacterium]|nr:cytochrome d ubiquinol oxidase subunit II [Holosporales bacterium]